ncbi:MAG: hypothetical protein ACTSQI_17950 [Candidatus Helarchaeota archaeon]
MDPLDTADKDSLQPFYIYIYIQEIGSKIIFSFEMTPFSKIGVGEVVILPLTDKGIEYITRKGTPI